MGHQLVYGAGSLIHWLLGQGLLHSEGEGLTSGGGGPSSVSVWPSSSSSGGSGLVGGGCCHTMASWACSLRYRLVRWVRLTRLTTFLGECRVRLGRTLPSPWTLPQAPAGTVACHCRQRGQRPGHGQRGGGGARQGTGAHPRLPALEVRRRSRERWRPWPRRSASCLCFSSSSLARTSSSPHKSAEKRAEGQGRPPSAHLTPRRWSQLTKRRLFHQGLSIEVGSVCHQQLHQVHLRDSRPGC